MTLLVARVQPYYVPAYFLFFSALIVTIRTDLETMLISRYTSLFLVPVFIGMSYLHYLPLSVQESIQGALFGYMLLYVIAFIFKHIRKQDGLGEGDMELLACIGAATGIQGAWAALFVGSIIGSTYALALRAHTIPFGPFLGGGALAYVLCENLIG